MKPLIVIVIHTLLLIGLTSGALRSYDKDSEKILEKSSDKVYPKKVLSLKKKPTKSPIIKSPIDSFKDLPEDDLEFIKELDKQFKLHGDKIKIKVERENSTSKNSKRTVEGDLGYGYYNGQASGGGYDYPKPKFTFYPYSQHDIPASAPGYHIKNGDQSTISIIPSYAYELKENNHDSYEAKTPFTPSQPDLGPTPSYHHQEEGQPQGQGHGYQYNEPVIVLRIPGPTKYASHLQNLLQQYLEIRAAQYLKILEDTEHQKLQQQQQQQQQQHHQYQQYEQVQEKPHQEVTYDHLQEQPEEPQGYAYAAPQQYPAIDDVYQSFKGRQQETHHQIEEQQYHQQQVAHGEQQQQYFYVNVQEQDQSANHAPHPATAPASGTTYQTMYYYAMEPPDYGQHRVYVVPQGYDDSPLPITENNPRSTHTKVHFTDGDNTDHSTQYPLPSIKPFERHAPKATPVHESYQAHDDGAAQANDYQHQQTDQEYYHASSSSAPQVVTITQRPFNYHAHSLRSKSSKRNASPTSVSSSNHSRRRIHTQINRKRNSDNIVPRQAKKEAI